MAQAVANEPDRIAFLRPLPGDALIGFVFGDRLNLRIVLADRSVDPDPERLAARGHQARRRFRVALMQNECPGQEQHRPSEVGEVR
jgi:hypothetical protein